MTDHDQEGIGQGVGLTALQVAAARAVHADQERPLVDDRFAAAFVRAAHRARPMPSSLHEARTRFADEPVWLDSSTYIGVRTRFFDDYFARATAAGVRQAVILAAGLDARAMRLRWPPNTTVYEIDHPGVLEFKDTVLDQAVPSCDRRVVPVDLRDDWSKALLETGFAPREPTAWLAEGLLPYLPPDAQRELFTTVGRLSGPGSWWAIEHTRNLADLLDSPEFDEVARDTDMDARPLLHADDRTSAVESLRASGWTTTVQPATGVARDYGQEIGPLVRRLVELSEFVVAHRV
ncbi:SAM-dependent methyltransferase [Amycolatopsis pigmentata]|uniref:S-adenosyl-L-methionine-dependent methyltransferase n=1 Tax=Amycolatopsis pigmentata TaxID=450801 RepID=A0ABW5FS90_9PSEU